MKDSVVILSFRNYFKFFPQTESSTHNEFLFNAYLKYAFEIFFQSKFFNLFNPNPSIVSENPKMHYEDTKYSDKNYRALVRTSDS